MNPLSPNLPPAFSKERPDNKEIEAWMKSGECHHHLVDNDTTKQKQVYNLIRTILNEESPPPKHSLADETLAYQLAGDILWYSRRGPNNLAEFTDPIAKESIRHVAQAFASKGAHFLSYSCSTLLVNKRETIEIMTPILLQLNEHAHSSFHNSLKAANLKNDYNKLFERVRILQEEIAKESA